MPNSEGPARPVGLDEARQQSSPKLRTFGLNSKEFYEAVTPPPDPWRWGPGLPREPRLREREVIVEMRKKGRG